MNMKSYYCYYYFSLLFVFIVHFTEAVEKRFVVVSQSHYHFYSDISEMSPDLLDEPIETKEQICKDVTGTYLFRRLREQQYRKRASHFSLSFGGGFTYPTKTIPVTLGSNEGFVTSAFVCLTRRRMRNKEYLISKEYNLNSGVNKRGDTYIAGRFIFHKPSTAQIRLFAIAELPAQMAALKVTDLETVYLERRAKHENALYLAEGEEEHDEEKDPLCKLLVEDVHRICAAVFASNHFADKVIFSPTARFEGVCKLRALSLQTPREERPVRGGILKEWMMNCEPTPSDPDKFPNEEYLISHAYESNQIFVYNQDLLRKQVFLYALMTDLRIVYDEPKPILF